MNYKTGDTHGKFSRIYEFCDQQQDLSKEDIMIILGDVGLNYFCDKRDGKRKKRLSSMPMTFLCIHGNHEKRPNTINSYMQKVWNNGIVYYEIEFPNILFAEDGEIYDFNGDKVMTIGGAYSIDKVNRIINRYQWFSDEQPSSQTKVYVEEQLDEVNWKVDMVLSHTCPRNYLPKEYLKDINQHSSIDQSTEIWLETIEQKLNYKRWFCGHHHININLGKVRFLFEEIIEF